MNAAPNVGLACPNCGHVLHSPAPGRYACANCRETYRADDYPCTHPMERVVPVAGEPGKSRCEVCGSVGTIMTQGPFGIILPKRQLLQ